MLPTWVLLPLLAIAIIVSQAYSLVVNFLRVVARIYFRKISVYGINNLPREGPVILCPNHPNMFVDAILVITECVRLGRMPYVWVKGSLFANPVAGTILRMLGSVPVFRPPKAASSLEDNDSSMTPEQLEAANRKMFEKTWDVLAAGNVMVLFPEGTSYTAPKMLKLRTGVVRVATGFVRNHDQPIPIIPVGLTYFNKDSFRSEVMLEFGTPYTLNPEDVASDSFKEDEKAEVKRMTEHLEEKMHEVTLNASDFATIRVARLMRRLYLNTAASIDANKELRLTQQIINMLERETTDEGQQERLKITREKVERYKQALDQLRIKDQDIVEEVQQSSLLQLFVERIVFLLVLLPLGTPGLLLNSPFYFIARKLNDLAGFVESKSMFKMMVLSILVPVQWLFLILVAWLIGGSSYAYAIAISLPLLLYSHIRVLEESRSLLENVYFLFNIARHVDQVKTIRLEREGLATQVNELVTEFVDPAFLATVQKSVEESNSPVRRRNSNPLLPRLRRVTSTADSLLR
ncbi:hypothetical protein Poli38472_000707 [Pythium oligandrum]|uniref:Phospholipid/glycerol acyltransferase domain-containing protein n=1 Tax=Pythium oligandrum TaxID=41045 RepID=A0A8K1CD85_PYTOL|nr:hypothetical protein Poli38472_000707 [Pythium oligandrum]|eukprot:TMW60665.1 hypothetical protein Poli38472_000707 [Pythium oligandrum]